LYFAPGGGDCLPAPSKETEMRSLWALCLLLTTAGAAAADIRPGPSAPRPKPSPPQHRIEAVPIAPGESSRVEIPRRLLAGEPLEPASSPLRTVMAGLLLSLAVVGGGLWAARRGQRGAAVVALAATVGGVGGAAWANMAPFNRSVRPASTDVAVSIRSSADDNIRLVLSREQLNALVAAYNRRSALRSPAPGSPAPSQAPRR